jgi:hypothetical protein
MADGCRSTGAGHMRIRALFISDLCLGTRDRRAERQPDPQSRDLQGLRATAPPCPHVQTAATQLS